MMSRLKERVTLTCFFRLLLAITIFLQLGLGQAEYPKDLQRNKYAAFRQEWRKKHPRGYHAWHSKDLRDWKLLGLVCPSSCMTSAEYVDGKFYLYYDEPNDENPHLIIDDDLTDGILGKEYGEVFNDPSHGSDAGVFRDEDGTFHMIYEDESDQCEG